MRKVLFIAGSIYFLTTTLVFAKKHKKSLIKQKVQVSTPVLQPPKVLISVFQTLGLKEAKIAFESFSTAKTHLNIKLVPLSLMYRKMKGYGVKGFQKCTMRSIKRSQYGCLRLKTIYYFRRDVQFGIYLGLGAIGAKIYVKYIFINLKTGKAVEFKKEYKNKEAFQHPDGFVKTLRRFFVTKKTLVLNNELPAKSKISCFASKTRKKIWTKILSRSVQVATKDDVTCLFKMPGYVTFKYYLKANDSGFSNLKIPLTKIQYVIVVRRRLVKLPKKSKPIPIFKKPVFWAIVGGGVAVVTGLTVGIAVATMQPAEPRISIPIR